MALLDRISTLIRANINELLDRAENPEKMLAQIVRDMAQAIGDARTQVTEVVAQAKMTQANAEAARALASDWDRKASAAVAKGAEDLARECLRRKRDYQTNAELYEKQLASQNETVARLKSDMRLLETKYAQTQRDADALLARHRVAKASEKIQRVSVLGTFDDPTQALKRMEDKIRWHESRVGAGAELAGESIEARLARLDIDSADLEVESDLLALKARLAPPAGDS